MLSCDSVYQTNKKDELAFKEIALSTNQKSSVDFYCAVAHVYQKEPCLSCANNKCPIKLPICRGPARP